MSVHSFLKVKTLAILSVLALVISFLIVTPVSSADFVDFDKTGDVEVVEEKENPYIFGNNVKVRESVQGDLFIAGYDVEVESDVVRGSITIFGNEVDLDASKGVGGSVRIVAQKVNIKGNFYNDILVLSDELIVEDSQIFGDLVVASDKISVTGSTIAGDFQGDYSKNKGDDLSEQVKGEIKGLPYGIDWNWDPEFDSDTLRSVFKLTNVIFWQIGIIILLVALSVFLSSRKKLLRKDIDFNKKFGFDLLTGAGFTFGPLIILFLSFFTVVLFAHSLMLTAAIYLLMGLASVYVPIYTANLLRNAAKLKNVQIGYLIALSYLVLFLIGLIPVFGGLVSFVLGLASFGYLSSALFKQINQGLAGKKSSKK